MKFNFTLTNYAKVKFLIIILLSLTFINNIITLETSTRTLTNTKFLTKFKSKSMTRTRTHTSTNTSTATYTSSKSKTSTNSKTESTSTLGGGLSFKQGMSFLNKKIKIKSNNLIDNIDISSSKNLDTIEKNPSFGDISDRSSNKEEERKVKVKSTIYWQGWARYFKVKKGEKPKSFFVNYSFQQQMKQNLKINLQEKNANGIYTHIPGPNYFYITIFQDNISIASSKEDRFKQNYDVVLIDLIAPILKDETYSGGIQDFGSFNEGYCFKIITTNEKISVPLNSSMKTIQYLFCCDTAEEKEKFLSSLRYVKFQKQFNNGLIITPKNNLKGIEQPDELLEDLMSGHQLNGTTEVKFNQDGRWVILQNWSQCSLKCGGGETVLHRFCIPPLGDGKPCDGESIIKKSCNIEPCKIYVNDLKKTKVITEKPEIKILPFSDRPQRYIKCKIKESDSMMFWETKDEHSDTLKKVLRPVRLVMNNFTLSIFENSNYNSNIMNFDLEMTKLFVSKEHPWCILIQQKFQNAELCNFSMDHKDTSFVEEWNYDFQLFKYKCHVDRKAEDVEKSINFKLRKKLNEIDAEMDHEKQDLISKKLSEDEKNKLTKKIIESADITFKAFQEETKLEDMIKKEEELKEEERQERLTKLITLEERKKKKMAETFKEKELETQTLLETQEQQIQLKKLKLEAGQKLLIKRNKLKKTISDMRKKSKIEEAKLTSKLLQVRSEIATSVKDASKKGDMENCKRGLESADKRKEYCRVKFHNEYLNSSKCDDEIDFCPTCCEKEFGSMYMNLRKECISNICSKISEKII